MGYDKVKPVTGRMVQGTEAEYPKNHLTKPGDGFPKKIYCLPAKLAPGPDEFYISELVTCQHTARIQNSSGAG